jgi:hypothetical protein
LAKIIRPHQFVRLEQYKQTPDSVRKCGEKGLFPRSRPTVSMSVITLRRDGTMDTQIPTAIDVDGFCRQHCISRAHFYNLLKRGEGPTVMKVGRRTLIGAEAAVAWRRRMEKASVDNQNRE